MEVFTPILSLVSSLLLAFFQCRFLIRYTGVKARIRYYFLYLLIFIADNSLLSVLLTPVFQSMPWQLSQPLNRLTGLVCIFLFARLALKCSTVLSIVSAQAVILVITLIEGASYPLLLLLSLLKPPPCCFLLFNMLCLFSFPFFSTWFQKNCRVSSLPGSKQKYLLLVLSPLLLVIILMKMIMDSSHTFYPDAAPLQSISGNGPLADTILLVIFSALSFLSTYGCLFSFQKLLSYFDTESRRLLLEQQLAVQKAYAEEAGLRYRFTRSLRHDLKNHLSVLRRLLDSGQTETALVYLEKFEESTQMLSFQVYTGNAAVDVLCGEKLACARQSGIDVVFDVSLPPDTGISDFDLCIIFANALDNAISACRLLEEKDRRIDIKAARSKRFLVIDSINACQKDAPFQEGTGLGNIRTVAEKYGGTVDVRCKEGCFVLTVLLTCGEAPLPEK